MTLGMIAAGLFIGSSLLCTTSMEPRVLGIPVIGFLGYLGAAVLSIYIVMKGRP
jgi:ubiquinone biosynthesis protein